MIGDAGITIVGGGLTAATAAGELRRLGYDGSLTLISEEEHPPYDRPPLSKEFLFEDPKDPEYLALPDDVELKLNEGVTSIDTARSVVTTDQGAEIRFASLLLAVGSRWRPIPVPGTELPQVHQLRTLDDAKAIKRSIGPGTRVVLAGGGLIGSELASGLVEADCQVTVADPDPLPLRRALGPGIAEALRSRMTAAGVEIIQAPIESFESGETDACTVGVGRRTIEADLVVVAAGAVPNVEIAREAGLKVANGIVCSHRGEASVAGIFAAGDVAEWPYAVAGHVRLEHWRGAIEQGKAVAASILGQTVAVPAPWMWTEQFGVRAEAAGFPSLGDRTVVVEDGGPEQIFIETYLGDELVGVAGIGAVPSVRRAAKQLGGVAESSAINHSEEGKEHSWQFSGSAMPA